MGRLRKVTLILPLVAASVALAACGSSTSGSTSGSSGKTLTVYVGAQPNYPQQFAQWSKDITAKFKAATGANLQIETYSSASDETTKIQTSIVSGSGPDVYVLGTTFTPVAYGTKGFLTLSAADWTAAGGKSRLLPQTLGMSGPNSSTQIGIPVAMRPFGMIYNTALFKAAGIANPPTTWDELIADAQKLTKNGVYGMAVGYADTYDPWKFIWAFTHQAGGSLVSKDLKTAQLNSPQVVNATTQYFDLLTKDKVVDPASAGWKDADAMAAFASGKAAIFPMATGTAINTLDGASSAVKGKYAFAPLPGVGPGMQSLPAGAAPAQTIVSGDNLAIASYTKNKDLALAYAKLSTDTAMQVEQFNLFGNLPTNQQALDQVLKDNPKLAPFADAEKGSTPTAFTGAFADIENGLANVVVQSLPGLAKGTYDVSAVKSLLDAANSKAQQSLNRAGQ